MKKYRTIRKIKAFLAVSFAFLGGVITTLGILVGKGIKFYETV